MENCSTTAKSFLCGCAYFTKILSFFLSFIFISLCDFFFKCVYLVKTAYQFGFSDPHYLNDFLSIFSTLFLRKKKPQINRNTGIETICDCGWTKLGYFLIVVNTVLKLVWTIWTTSTSDTITMFQAIMLRKISIHSAKTKRCFSLHLCNW